MRRLMTSLLCASVFAGCSAGGHSVAPGAAPGNASPASGARTLARFVIKVPAKHASAAIRSPKYISTSTNSIGIAVAGGAATLTNLTPASPNCATVSGALTCTVNVPAPVGTDSFVVTTYDATVDNTGALSAGAQPLSTATVTATIAANVANTVDVTLGGIVASVVLTANPTTTIARTAATIPLTVTAKDADGNTIVGPGAFSSPITITNSDATGGATLSSSTVADPSQTALSITLSGSLGTGAITFSANAAGLSAGNVTPAILQITAGVAARYSQGLGNAQTGAVVKGPDGNFWFADTQNNAIDVLTPAGAITHRYPVTGLGSSGPFDITNGPPGDSHLYFTDYGGVGSINVANGAIVAYPVANGGGYDARIVLGPGNKLWFTGGSNGSTDDVIGSLDPTLPASAGNPAIHSNLMSANARPIGIAKGSDNNLWFVESGQGKVGRYNVSGPLAGTVTEFNIPTPNSAPTAITAGADGNLWFNEGSSANRVAKITPAGAITEFVTAHRASGPSMISMPDGRIFFSEDPRDDVLGSVTTSGTVTEYPETASINFITVDGPGSLYFTQTFGPSGLGRFVY